MSGKSHLFLVMVYRVVLSALFLICICISTTHAQVFQGVVVDDETGEPIPYSSIFLTNTTLGVGTDENGGFSINIPWGNYEVVVRRLGYELLVINLRPEEIGQFYRIKLKPDPKQLAEFEIERNRDEQWYKNLEIFKKHFLGTSKIARKCIIINPEVLIMDSGSEKSVLKVSAKDVIKISNPKLGYEIDYVLTYFKLDSSSNEVYYEGYPSFKSLPKYKSKVPGSIVKNREKAYLGSINHFLRCVFYETDKEEGYLIRRVKLATNPNRPNENNIAKAKREMFRTNDPSERDSLFRNFTSKDRLPLYAGVYQFPYAKANTFTKRIEGDRVLLKFEDYLEVTYTNEFEDIFYNGSSARHSVKPQTSFIKLTVPHTEINYQGITSKHFDLYFLGYMAWEKMGDMMPIDYIP